jgi:hypothetical protein
VLKINSVADLQAGDVGFGIIPGRIGGWVSVGQALLHDACWFSHAFIVEHVDPEAQTAYIVEAWPGGARRVKLLGSDRCGPGWGWVRLPLSTAQLAAIADSVRLLVGTPYSFLDYLSLALMHLGLPRSWVAGRVANSGHLICSQLVDRVLADVGFHLFDDGRPSGDVTPGALFRKAGARGEVFWA